MRGLILILSLSIFDTGVVKAQKRWAVALELKGKTIDFILEQPPTKTHPPQYRIWNGMESIDLNTNEIQGDSIVCPISVFDAALKFPLSPKETFGGFYLKNDTRIANYRASFSANPYPGPRSNPVSKSLFNWGGQWLIEFLEKGQVSDTGVAIIRMKGDSLYGSVLSETGDYRYLNGMAKGSTAYLQTFDGAHTYRFDFTEDGSGTLIYSRTGQSEFRWKRLDSNPLTDGYSKSKGIETAKFSFKAMDTTGLPVNEQTGKLKSKALVVQVLGSWCPNCLDETRFLTEVYAQRPENVEFVGLAFERKNDPAYANSRIEVVKKRLKVPYPIYWAGISSKDSASKVIPSITQVLSFPTTIFVQRDGSVLAVHTGFTGPATGIYYTNWKQEFTDLLKKLSIN